MATWQEIAVLGSIIILSFSGILYYRDFKAVLAEYPDASYIILSDDTIYQNHILTRTEGGFARWKIVKDKWNTVYSNRSLMGQWTFEVEYYRTYGEPDRWVRLIPKRTLVTTEIKETGSGVVVRKITPYYASAHSGSGGRLIEEYILPYDAQSSTKINVIFEPNKKSPDRTDDLHRVTMRFSSSKEMESWQNHVIFGGIQFSFEDAKDKIDYITAEEVRFKEMVGERIEIDPIIRIGDVAITYKLQREDLAGRSYTPTCLTRCDLTFNVSVNKNVYINDWQDFRWKVIKRRGAVLPKNIQLQVLRNTTYDKKFINVTETFSTYQTINGSIIQNATITESRWTEERWKWVWVDIKPPFVIKKDKVYSINLRGAKLAQLGENGMDVTPIVKNIEIPFAWWDSNWGYYTNITIIEPGTICRNASTGLPNEPIDTHFTPTTAPDNCTKEFRVVNETGDEIDSQVWNETYSGGKCIDANVVFTMNMSISETRIFSIYYGYASATEPSYTNRTNFNEYDGNSNDGILSIDGHKRFQMSNGAIRENYGDTDTYSSGLEYETQNVYDWGHEWNDLDNKGIYRIGNDSTGVIDGPIKTTINITNASTFGITSAVNYLIDIYSGRQVAFYRFASYCRNSDTDTGCGDWAGAAERNEDCIGYVQAIDNVPPDAIWRRHSDGTVASEVGGVDYFINYGFISGDIGSTDIRVLGWQDEGGSTQTDAVGYGNAGNHRPKYRQFSDTWSAADSDGNFSNMTVFYHEINQNTGTKLNDSWMAYTNPPTTSFGTEQTPPAPDNPPTYALNSTNSTTADTDIMHSLNWTDETALSGYIFQFCDGNWNGSGCEGGSEEWSYQENSNVTFCDGTWFITEGCDDAYDGDWDDYGHSASGVEAYLFVNYTKPSNILNTSLWQVKDGVGMVNLSLDNDCIVQDILQFRVNSTSGGTFRVSDWGCWNGTGWQSLRFNTGVGPDVNKIYEEAVWWKRRSFGGWTNDTWTSFGAGTWSNVTKTVNSTVGAMVAWCVYANDSIDQWNGSSCGLLPETPFNYTTTAPVGDDCDCPASGDWIIDEECVIDDDCSIVPNDLYLRCTGYVTLDAVITIRHRYRDEKCHLEYQGGSYIEYVK